MQIISVKIKPFVGPLMLLSLGGVIAYLIYQRVNAPSSDASKDIAKTPETTDTQISLITAQPLYTTPEIPTTINNTPTTNTSVNNSPSNSQTTTQNNITSNVDLGIDTLQSAPVTSVYIAPKPYTEISANDLI